jgi:hypothetical protein
LVFSLSGRAFEMLFFPGFVRARRRCSSASHRARGCCRGCARSRRRTSRSPACAHRPVQVVRFGVQAGCDGRPVPPGRCCRRGCTRGRLRVDRGRVVALRSPWATFLLDRSAHASGLLCHLRAPRAGGRQRAIHTRGHTPISGQGRAALRHTPVDPGDRISPNAHIQQRQSGRSVPQAPAGALKAGRDPRQTRGAARSRTGDTPPASAPRIRKNKNGEKSPRSLFRQNLNDRSVEDRLLRPLLRRPRSSPTNRRSRAGGSPPSPSLFFLSLFSDVFKSKTSPFPEAGEGAGEGGLAAAGIVCSWRRG